MFKPVQGFRLEPQGPSKLCLICLNFCISCISSIFEFPGSPKSSLWTFEVQHSTIKKEFHHHKLQGLQAEGNSWILKPVLQTGKSHQSVTRVIWCFFGPWKPELALKHWHPQGRVALRLSRRAIVALVEIQHQTRTCESFVNHAVGHIHGLFTCDGCSMLQLNTSTDSTDQKISECTIFPPVLWLPCIRVRVCAVFWTVPAEIDLPWASLPS
jgi:hypothetical protein